MIPACITVLLLGLAAFAFLRDAHVRSLAAKRSTDESEEQRAARLEAHASMSRRVDGLAEDVEALRRQVAAQSVGRKR